MQLNITTDYAIRMLYLLGDGGMKTLGELSEQAQISRAYAGKVIKKLKKSGILGSAVGVKGGVFLKKPLEEIRLYDVCIAMEPTMKINRCLEDDAYCGIGASPDCPVRRYYLYVQDKLENDYLSVNLKDIRDRKYG